MRNALRAVGLVLLAGWLVGCATTSVNTVTNLTASRLPRKDNGQYLFGVAFDTKQRTMLKDTVQVDVIIGNQEFPMTRTRYLTNRWETLVPVPAGERLVNYRYRFRYSYKAIPDIRPMSFDSSDYQLTITERW